MGRGPGMDRIGVLMGFSGFPRGTLGKWGVGGGYRVGYGSDRIGGLWLKIRVLVEKSGFS